MVRIRVWLGLGLGLELGLVLGIRVVGCLRLLGDDIDRAKFGSRLKEGSSLDLGFRLVLGFWSVLRGSDVECPRLHIDYNRAKFIDSG
jgi:hypothetical protein